MTHDYFSHRKKFGMKLTKYLVEQGYSKKSFFEYAGISITTLDKFLKGEINNEKMYKKYLKKIIKKLNVKPEEISTNNTISNTKR